MAFWSSLFCKPICPLLPSTAHIDVSEKCSGKSGKCSPLMRRHPMEASIPDITFHVPLICLYLRTFSFFPFFFPSCPPLPPSLPPTILSLSFFDKRKQSGKYLASFPWPTFVSRLPETRSQHPCLCFWSGLCCGHQTCKEQSFMKRLGSVASGRFRETSGVFVLKEVSLPEFMVLKIGIIPSWLTLFQILLALWRCHRVVFIPKCVSLNTVSKEGEELFWKRWGWILWASPVLHKERCFFPFLLLRAFNMWMCIENIQKEERTCIWSTLCSVNTETSKGDRKGL